MKKNIVLAVLTALALSGCGSMINGSTQNMSVSASPSNAKIELLSATGAKIFESSGSLKYNLKRSNGFFDGASYNIKISAPGFKEQLIPITSSASGWYIGGNILLGGFIGWLIVDPATGGMWSLDTQNGQDIEKIKVMLIQDATDKMMSKAKKIKVVNKS